MKIQEVMMKQLGCVNWEQVTEDYPLTSSYKALFEYFITFKDWVSISLVKNVFFVYRGCVLILNVLLPLLETVSWQETKRIQGYTRLPNILPRTSRESQKRKGSTLNQGIRNGR